MVERRTRRRFTAEFKAEAVQRLLEGGRGLSEVATELGLSPGQLGAWRNEHLAAGSAEALAARKAEQAELQRLKRENKRLEEEVEILRKAAAFFARGIGASVSGFYAWLRAIPLTRARADAEAELRGLIGRIFAARRRAYGSRRVHAELRREGQRHSRRRVERLMREMGLQARRGRRRPRRGPPTAGTTSRSPRTCSTATSSPSGPTRSGWPTSATCRPA